MSYLDKIFTDRAALAARLTTWRGGGAPGSGSVRVVFTNGCFDLLHPGHVAYLTRARELGTHLVIGVNSDESLRELKGTGRPVLPLDQRLKVLAGLACVSAVIGFSEPDPRPLIVAIKPDVLVKGGDYRLDQILGREEVASWGGETTTVPLLPGYSTTAIIERMRRG